MATVPALTDRTETQRWAAVRDEDDLWGDLRPELLEAVRTILETTMEDELAAELVATRYQRTPWRTDLRNGSYQRSLVTELGAITDLRIPRRRLVPYRPSFLDRAARRTRSVDRVLRQAFLRGLSTRETAALAATLTGVSLSAASVSRLARELDGQVSAFHRRPITFPARYLLVDGLWLSVRQGRTKRRVVLAAYGIAADGRRELLDYRQAASESSAEWTRFLTSLVGRGLDPDAVCLVTADGADGIAAAVAEVFPEADLQRCWTHRVRNLLDAIPLAERRSCLAGLRAIHRARRDGRRSPPTGAGRGAGDPAIRVSCGGSKAISTTSSRCSPYPRRSAASCARRTSSSAPFASSAGGSGRSAHSPTGGRRTGSSMARSSDSTNSWPAAPSRHSHKSLDVTRWRRRWAGGPGAWVLGPAAAGGPVRAVRLITTLPRARQAGRRWETGPPSPAGSKPAQRRTGSVG